MTDCIYCHDTVLDFQQINGEGDHTKCGREYIRRKNMNACVHCGTYAKKSDNDSCDDCLKNTADYSGYEGPGQ